MTEKGRVCKKNRGGIKVCTPVREEEMGGEDGSIVDNFSNDQYYC